MIQNSINSLITEVITAPIPSKYLLITMQRKILTTPVANTALEKLLVFPIDINPSTP